MVKAESKEIQEGKIFAVISYMIILCVVTLALKKENRFALFHGKQGLVILIFWVASIRCRTRRLTCGSMTSPNSTKIALSPPGKNRGSS